MGEWFELVSTSKMYLQEKWAEPEIEEHIMKVYWRVYIRCSLAEPKSAFEI